MKKLLLLFILCMSQITNAIAEDNKVKLTIFDGVIFYDGYLFKNNPDSALQDGVLRHSTSLYAVKLAPEQIAQIGEALNMNVKIEACCDNYDRIGNVNIAIVPKDSADHYIPDSVKRIEIGRFITPFMNKNKYPKVVPYSYNIDYVSNILRDETVLANNNIWIEFEVFGIPYAANEQISGCKGRNDVFKGTLEFETTSPAQPLTDKNVLVPIVIKKPEYKGNNLNNYNELATDTLGKTVKTYTYEVPQDVADGMLVITTSNHGANAGGEEYNRRWHYVYCDGTLALTYKPGRTTCEPFRKYNTQANGIYGWSAMTDTEWQSFSNWCPGDVIDNRIIKLGEVKAGTHTVTISVPTAKFKDKKGDIPVSIFFEGVTEGKIYSGIEELEITKAPLVNLTTANGMITAHSQVQIIGIELYNLQGVCLYQAYNQNTIPMQDKSTGVYLVNVELANGIIATHKIQYNQQ